MYPFFSFRSKSCHVLHMNNSIGNWKNYKYRVVLNINARGGELRKNDGKQVEDGKRGRIMYENRTVEEVCKEFSADLRTGLSAAEVEVRQRHYGENELRENPPPTMIRRIAAQLCDSLIFVLFAAAGISLLLGEYGDAAVILAVVILNAAVGVIQEGKAEKALESLKRMTQLEVLVIRDGRESELPAKALVPGDLVVLDAGRQVPADLRLVETAGMKVEEAALTGESRPVEKNSRFLAGNALPAAERKNEVFMTSYVTAGRGKGIVIATGMNTEVGRIASLIRDTPEEETPLQRRLADLGRLLSFLTVGLCVLLFALAVWQKRDVLEMLITAISLAVAAVPEGLPAVVTIVLAMGVTRMARVGTIVRRLPSVETLGAVSVVCSDKTGTLTKNEMTVTACYVNQKEYTENEIADCAGSASGKRLLEVFALCNDAREDVGEATERALLSFCELAGVHTDRLRKKYPRKWELPFDSTRKRMTTVHEIDGSICAYTKGAPDVILQRCRHEMMAGRIVPLTDARKAEIEAEMESMSARALRVLAGAWRKLEAGKRREAPDVDENMVFLGLAGMMDPPREEAAGAVRAFERAAVRTVMITGDHADTALAVARKLGIARTREECMTGSEMDLLEEGELEQRIGTVAVFARVSPEHKVRIVRALKQRGWVTAMTGDGVNDAPALKAADIGIAMGKGGTDVARQAADVILTDDNFATIERAIEEGRGIYENIRKSILFLLSSNLGEILTMFVAVVAGIPAPLGAAHILWINLITDSLPALALGMDENDREALMGRPPRQPGESLFAGGGWFCMIFYGILIAAVSLGAFLYLPWKYGMVSMAASGREIAGILGALKERTLLVRAQTYAFTVLGLSELFHAVGMRALSGSAFSRKEGKNPLMLFAFLFGLVMQILVTEIPGLTGLFHTVRLTPIEWLLLLLAASLPLVAHELLAVIGRR